MEAEETRRGSCHGKFPLLVNNSMIALEGGFILPLSVSSAPVRWGIEEQQQLTMYLQDEYNRRACLARCALSPSPLSGDATAMKSFLYFLCSLQSKGAGTKSLAPVFTYPQILFSFLFCTSPLCSALLC